MNRSAKWDERYSQEEFAYGREPNEFLKEQIRLLQPGKILFPAEGEGRNAVYAATLGWETMALDISEAGRKKALLLAQQEQVSLEYLLGDPAELHLQENHFDAMALIYAHFPPAERAAYHRILIRSLKTGGTLIFEAFSKHHLQYVTKNEKVGGPKDYETLFSIDEIRNEFTGFHFKMLEEQVISLQEGLYHNGEGAVIRFVAVKE